MIEHNESSKATRQTIASYPGGKSNYIKHHALYACLPDKINLLVEPFSGLANFYFNIYSITKNVLLNDINVEVCSLLRVVQDKKLLNQLIRKIQNLEPIEREEYYHWKSNNPNSVIDCAIKLLVILNCSPNGAGGGYSFEKAHRKWYRNKQKTWFELSKRLKNAVILNEPYQDVLTDVINGKTSADFIYLDPPYYDVAKKGKLYRSYDVIEWKKLLSLLEQIRCKWLLSNRDCPEMRALFCDFYQKSYNTYNDMNNKKNNNPELLIANFKI
ncbi:MAG: DNA adenine methylase [Candidatus Thorarchaeota archaeon]